MHHQLLPSVTVFITREGLSPILVSSAEHRPKQLAYQPSASCVL